MDILIQLVGMLLKFYGFAVLLRFFLQYFRADFYNPVSQSIVKLTNPVLLPIRKIIPGYGGIDWASIVISFLIGSLVLTLFHALWQHFSLPNLLPFLAVFLLQLIYTILDFFFFLAIARIILSFLMMGQNIHHNPFATIIIQVTNPVMRPFQRLIPPVGVFDFSPMILFIAIWLAQSLLLKAAHYIIPGIRLI